MSEVLKTFLSASLRVLNCPFICEVYFCPIISHFSLTVGLQQQQQLTADHEESGVTLSPDLCLWREIKIETDGPSLTLLSLAGL